MSAPEKLIIDTPEQIALEFPLASAGSRFLALAIDTLIQASGFLLLAALALLATAIGIVFPRLATWGMALLLLAAFAIYYGYFALFEALWNGQTPGKRAIGIRAISASGRPMSAFDAVLRNLLRIVDQLPGIYAVGLIALFFSERNQRLGDLAAGTVVVYERAFDRPTAPAPVSGVRYGAARLSAPEIALVERFLHRRTSMEAYLKISTARQIVARIRHRLDLPEDARIDDERLLEEVAAEYRSRR